MNRVSKPLITQGWIRALLYMIALFGLLVFIDPLSRILLTKLTGEAKPSPDDIGNFILLYSTSGVAIVLLTWAFRTIVDRSTIFSLGFQWKGFENEAWTGFVAGPLIIGIGSLVLIVAGYTNFIGLEWTGNSFLLQLLAMVIVAFVEEIMFRGYLLHNLLQSFNKPLALVSSAVLFGLLHIANPDVNLLAIINILVAGIFLGLNYIYTKNLWFGIFFHFSWNFFQGPVYGFEVSGLQLQSIFKQSTHGPHLFTGGPFGFEGSVLCPVLLIICGFAMFNVFRHRYSILPGVNP